MRGHRSRKPIGFRQWVVHDKECNEDEHEWEYQTETVTEEVLVKEAWEEPVEVTEDAIVCNNCNKVFGKSEYGSYDDAGDALAIHQFEDSPSCVNGWRTEKVTYTYYIHHDAEYKTVTTEKKRQPHMQQMQ